MACKSCEERRKIIGELMQALKDGRLNRDEFNTRMQQMRATFSIDANKATED